MIGFSPNSAILAPVMTPQSGRTGRFVEKNRLTTADAQRVEEAFQTEPDGLCGDLMESEPEAHRRELGDLPTPARADPGRQPTRPRSRSIDKSVLALPEPRRHS